MKKTLFFLTVFSFILLFSSCLKEEGVGGSSVIEGYLNKVIHADDNYTLTADTITAGKTDVYIIYGNEKHFGDKVDTGPDGFFQFKYLTKGTYTIYAFSTYASGRKDSVSVTVTLGKKGKKSVGTLYIHEGKAFGTSIVRGKVLTQYWNKDIGNTVKNPDASTRKDAASNVRVFIQRKIDDFHIDDVRTSDDGTFIFQKLSPGEYKIYVYTVSASDIGMGYNKIMSPIFQTITVSEVDAIFEIPTPFLITQVL